MKYGINSSNLKIKVSHVLYSPFYTLGQIANHEIFTLRFSRKVHWDVRLLLISHQPLTLYLIYNGILLSHQKEWKLAIYNNMDGPWWYNTKWKKLEDKYYMISLICGIKKTKQKQTHRYREQQISGYREERG